MENLFGEVGHVEGQREDYKGANQDQQAHGNEAEVPVTESRHRNKESAAPMMIQSDSQAFAPACVALLLAR
jgi:hypothetical protein